MDKTNSDWEKRLQVLWASINTIEPNDFIEKINTIVSELPDPSAVGLFEQASAQDSTGHPKLAVPLYQKALEAGLSGIRRRRATIQLASSLRNLGNPQKAYDLLSPELSAESDELDDAVIAFLALVLVDLGREREAVSLSLEALSHHLPRYNQSLARYAQNLISGT